MTPIQLTMTLRSDQGVPYGEISCPLTFDQQQRVLELLKENSVPMSYQPILNNGPDGGVSTQQVAQTEIAASTGVPQFQVPSNATSPTAESQSMNDLVELTAAVTNTEKATVLLAHLTRLTGGEWFTTKQILRAWDPSQMGTKPSYLTRDLRRATKAYTENLSTTRNWVEEHPRKSRFRLVATPDQVLTKNYFLKEQIDHA